MDFDEHVAFVIAALEPHAEPSSGSTGDRGRLQRRYRPPAMPEPLKIIVLEGDETGQELLEQSLRVLDPELLGLELELSPLRPVAREAA